MSPKISSVEKPTKSDCHGNVLYDQKTNFRLVIYQTWNLAKIGQVNFEIIGLAEIVTERNGSRTYTQQPDGLNKTKCRQVHSLQQIVSFFFILRMRAALDSIRGSVPCGETTASTYYTYSRTHVRPAGWRRRQRRRRWLAFLGPAAPQWPELGLVTATGTCLSCCCCELHAVRCTVIPNVRTPESKLKYVIIHQKFRYLTWSRVYKGQGPLFVAPVVFLSLPWTIVIVPLAENCAFRSCLFSLIW